MKEAAILVTAILAAGCVSRAPAPVDERRGSVLTAPLGAWAAHTLPVKQLKRVFASILYLLAAYMLYRGLKSL